MFSSSQLKKIITEIRPIIERQLDDAQLIAGFRNTVAEQGGDWSALKALVKAQIKDERDEAGDGKHVRAILERAEYSSVYADMLGWTNMNENNFSADNSLPEATVKGEADGIATGPRTASPTESQVGKSGFTSPIPDPVSSFAGTEGEQTGTNSIPACSSPPEPGDTTEPSSPVVSPTNSDGDLDIPAFLDRRRRG